MPPADRAGSVDRVGNGRDLAELGHDRVDQRSCDGGTFARNGTGDLVDPRECCGRAAPPFDDLAADNAIE